MRCARVHTVWACLGTCRGFSYACTQSLQYLRVPNCLMWPLSLLRKTRRATRVSNSSFAATTSKVGRSWYLGLSPVFVNSPASPLDTRVYAEGTQSYIESYKPLRFLSSVRLRGNHTLYMLHTVTLVCKEGQSPRAQNLPSKCITLLSMKFTNLNWTLILRIFYYN